MWNAHPLDRYTAATVQLFRVEAMAARALGDEESARGFEAAIEALIDEPPASTSEPLTPSQRTVTAQA